MRLQGLMFEQRDKFICLPVRMTNIVLVLTALVTSLQLNQTRFAAWHTRCIHNAWTGFRSGVNTPKQEKQLYQY